MNSATSSAVEKNSPLPKLRKGGSCTILIPAYNEAATIGSVVRTCLQAKLGPVLVVDDGSSDETAAYSRQAGADVLSLATNIGKGGAVVTGAQASDAAVLLLVDADLTGLTPDHLHALALPVLSDTADMTRGVFVGGRWRTTAAQRLIPQLNGQRAIRRDLLLSVLGLRDSRYGIEVAITNWARAQRWRTQDIPLSGVSQVMKEEKRGLIRGFLTRLRMYRDILGVLVRNRQ